MNPRLRLVIVLAFVVIIIGVVAAFVLGSGPSAPAQQPEGTADVAGQSGDNGDGAPVVESGPSPTPIEIVEVVIAIQDIPRGLTIPPNAVAIRQFPLDLVQEWGPSVLSDPEVVIGQRARTDIVRFQPILSNMVVEDPTALASVGSDLAAILPPNRVAVALPIDRITSVAYGIQPGDRVDIIISLLFVNVDTAFQSIEPNRLSVVAPNEDGSLNVLGDLPGRFDTVPAGTLGTVDVLIVPREEPRPRLTTQRTVQDALVMWSGDFPIDGRLFFGAPTPTPVPPPDEEEASADSREEVPPTPVPARPDIITLAVSPQEAVTITCENCC